MEIFIRRGTKAELDTILLSSGELGFTTDSKEVFVGDGVENYLIGRVLFDSIANRPSPSISGRIFHALEGTTYLDNGSSWVSVGVSNIDNVPDGTTYGKIKLSELNNGRVVNIYDEVNASNVSGQTINEHINNSATLHRTINDSGLSVTDLWSAEKITAEIESKLSGLSWKDPVIVINVVSDANQGGSPPSALQGDSYIANNWGGAYIDNTIYEYNGTSFVSISTVQTNTRIVISDVGAAGSFTSQENNIAEYNGSYWEFYVPSENTSLFVSGNNSLNENKAFTFSGSEWINFGLSTQLLPDEVSIIIDAYGKLAINEVDGGTF